MAATDVFYKRRIRNKAKDMAQHIHDSNPCADPTSAADAEFIIGAGYVVSTRNGGSAFTSLRNTRSPCTDLHE